MPRYFFNIRDGTSYPDLQGAELPDLNAARKEAIRFAGALLSHDPDTFWTGKGWCLEVCDDYGLHLFTLRFAAEEAPSVRRTPYKTYGPPRLQG